MLTLLLQPNQFLERQGAELQCQDSLHSPAIVSKSYNLQLPSGWTRGCVRGQLRSKSVFFGAAVIKSASSRLDHGGPQIAEIYQIICQKISNPFGCEDLEAMIKSAARRASPPASGAHHSPPSACRAIVRALPKPPAWLHQQPI